MDIPHKHDKYDTRDYLKALIDGYRYGEISAEDVCRKAYTGYKELSDEARI